MEPPDPAEISIDLSRVRVRLIEPGERERWDALVREHHYLGLRALVGHSLRYVAHLDEHWLALLSWSSAALKCAARDRWIGWSAPLQWQRLGLIANNTRFLILPGPRCANLASKVLGANLARLSADWQAAHAQPLVLAETFIDPARFAGTCYRASNWLDLGPTRGFAKSNTTYSAHGQIKHILVYALERKARAILSDALIDPRWCPREPKPMQLSLAQADDLMQRLSTLPDPRKRRGVRHSYRSELAVVACAMFSGATGPSAIAQWARNLSQGLLKRLRCPYSPRLQRHVAPSESSIRRTLADVDVAGLEGAVAGWLKDRAVEEPSKAIAVDGKTLRGSTLEGKQMHLISALTHDGVRVLNQIPVDQKSNETTALKPLLDPLALAGKILTADALHTQREAAR